MVVDVKSKLDWAKRVKTVKLSCTINVRNFVVKSDFTGPLTRDSDGPYRKASVDGGFIG